MKFFNCNENSKEIDVLVLTNSVPNDKHIAYVPDTYSGLVVQVNKNLKIKESRDFIKKILDCVDIKVIVCSTANSFKACTGLSQTNRRANYVHPSVGKKETVVLSASLEAAHFDPTVHGTISNAKRVTEGALSGTRMFTTNEVISVEAIDRNKIQEWLTVLSKKDLLTVDVETYGLKINAGIGTIAFGYEPNKAVAFNLSHTIGHKGTITPEIRKLFRDFFNNYKGILVGHNIKFDFKAMIHDFYMCDKLSDTHAMLEGLDALTRNYECTHIMAYCVNNSTHKVSNSLKDLSVAFMGDYAIDVKDITTAETKDLLHYNGLDCIATYKLYNSLSKEINEYEAYPKFIAYNVDIIEMECTGMPVCMDAILKAEEKVANLQSKAISKLTHSKIPSVRKALALEAMQAHHSKLKTEAAKKPLEHYFEKTTFKHTSPAHLRALIGAMGYTTKTLTATGLMATDKDNINYLISKAKKGEDKLFFEALKELNSYKGLANTFIPTLKNAIQLDDGTYRVYGNFNIGGTVSSRLSSNGPNLQNMPAHGELGKIIKSCIQAPAGYILASLDFDSLEDKISALTSKDPNKLKIYIDGFDGHCYRAYIYFGDEMTGIDPTCVESINSIKKKYPELRNASKSPTFLLTYEGTAYGLVMQFGFEESVANKIFAQYRKEYKVCIDWVDDKVKTAFTHGYVKLAFGHRIKTPSLYGKTNNPAFLSKQEKADLRTSKNAVGQSYCTLNLRANNELRAELKARKMRHLIRPWASIHDANYVFLLNNYKVLKVFNDLMVKAAQWQEDPEIAHPQVKLSGTSGVHPYSLANEIEIPNFASVSELHTVIKKGLENLAQ